MHCQNNGVATAVYVQIQFERFHGYNHSRPGELFQAQYRTNEIVIVRRLQPHNCEFNVDIVVSSEQLTFDPSFERFKDVLCGLLDDICRAVRYFNTLETQLYLDWSSPEEFLEVQH